MRKLTLPSILFLLFLLVGALAGMAWGDAGDGGGREAAIRFATLPDGVRFPEGITANPETGEVFVGTFDFGPNNNKLLRFRKNGRLDAQRDFGRTLLLGLEFNPRDRKVYIANVGALVGGVSKIQRIVANFTGTTLIEDVAVIPGKPEVGAPPDRTEGNPDGSTDTITFGNNAPAPNALVFNAAGDLFVSDSFQGAIFKIERAHTCTGSCPVTTVVHDGRLATGGFPPFGANGLALSKDGTTLFIANTGDDRILRMNVASGSLDPDPFAESINGADGIAFDRKGRLLVAANQADEIVVLNNSGRVIAELGDFLGIRRDGAVRGLLFPASLVIVGDDVFVTNLALPLNGVAGDEPEEDVTTFTVSRIPLRTLQSLAQFLRLVGGSKWELSIVPVSRIVCWHTCASLAEISRGAGYGTGGLALRNRVRDLADRIRKGAKLPGIFLAKSQQRPGAHWILDGHHRLLAHRVAKAPAILAYHPLGMFGAGVARKVPVVQAR